jgi:uncharacterized protein
VKLVDANVLLYAVNTDAAHHERSRDFLDRSLSGHDTVAFAWIALLAFVRLSTKAGLFPRPLAVDRALEQVERWLGAPAAVLVEPTPRHATVLHGLLAPLGTGGNLVNDAHLAALAVEHRCTIVSYDGDFARFRGVTWEMP